MRKNQGFANLVLIVILLIGLAVAIYLVGTQTVFKNRANSTPLSGTNPSPWGNAINLIQSPLTYLTVPAYGTTGALKINGSFTVEAYVKPPATPPTNNNAYIVCKTFVQDPHTTVSGPGKTPFCVWLQWYQISGVTHIQPVFGVGTGGYFYQVAGGKEIPADQWSHIAVSVDATSGKIRAFVNGINSYTNDLARQLTFDDPNVGVYIGVAYNQPISQYEWPFTGQIDEVRISNNLRYTANFTPPATPFITDSSTLALWHFDQQLCPATCYTPDASANANNAYISGSGQLVQFVLSTVPTVQNTDHLNCICNDGTTQTTCTTIDCGSGIAQNSICNPLCSQNQGLKATACFTNDSTCVSPPFQFALLNSGNQTTNPGVLATNTITASLLSGLPQIVSFTAAGTPPGSTVGLARSCNPTCSFIMSIQTNSTTPTGTYNVVVTGTAGSLIQTTSFILTVAPSQINLNSGLNGYWKMDETFWSGTPGEVVDSSGSKHNGTAVNGAVPTAGKFGNAGYFKGVSQYVRVPSFTEPYNSDFSVSYWFKPNQKLTKGWSATHILLSGFGGNPGAGGIDAMGDIQTSGAIRAFLYANNGGFPDISTNKVSWNANQWYHLVFTYVAGTKTLSVYVNGVLDNSMTANAYQWNAESNFYLGGNAPYSASYFNGQIDDARIYNRALSANEVYQLFKLIP